MRQELRQAGGRFGGFAKVGKFGSDVGADGGLERDELVQDAEGAFALITDQRGGPRPFDFPYIVNPSGGDGSDIGAFERGRPKLALQQFGSSAVLSWPSYYGEFSLQSSTNITSSNNWLLAPGSAAVVGNQYQQTNSPISGDQFFRLRGN